MIGAVVAVAGGAAAGYKLMNDGPDYAQVTHVEPVMKTVRTPREDCQDVPVNAPLAVSPVIGQNAVHPRTYVR